MAVTTDKTARQSQAKQQRDAELTARRQRVAEAKRERAVYHERRNQEIAERAEAERREASAAVDAAYRNYLHVRDWARGHRHGAGVVLSAAEERLAGALAPLWDAGPDVIARLRRWCEPISGVGAAAYEPASDDLTMRLKHAVAYTRRQVGSDLFVQESPALGGFGIQRRRELYNEDTVRYFKAITALHDGAVLGECRRSVRRHVVWEIGGGWGGFAYHFKTVSPNVTYLITGMPETLLVAAVYLMSVFPRACCRFYDGSSPDAFWRDWEQVDFAFVPEGALSAWRPPAVDVTIDISALMNMTAARAARHVEHAFEWGARYFYSMLPTAAVDGHRPVWDEIGRRYWPHPIPPRVDTATIENDDPLVPLYDEYSHLVGWRRLLV